MGKPSPEEFSGLWESGTALAWLEQTIRFGEGGPVYVSWALSTAKIQAQDLEQSRHLNTGRKEARVGIQVSDSAFCLQ